MLGMMDIFSKMMMGEIPTGHETIASKTFTTADGAYTAMAEISVTHEVSESGELGEIVNGGCDVITGGGVVYSAETYAEAIRMAESLIKHWDSGDYDWQPKKAQW